MTDFDRWWKEPRTCEHLCYETYDEDWRYCPECGTQVTDRRPEHAALTEEQQRWREMSRLTCSGAAANLLAYASGPNLMRRATERFEEDENGNIRFKRRTPF